MILKALYDRYMRLQDIGKPLAPFGFKELKIHFVVVLDSDGRFLRVEDRRIEKKDAQQFYVLSESRTSGIKPYAFFDNMEYCFGFSSKEKPEKSRLKHESFIKRCVELAERYPENQDFSSVVKFYRRDEHKNAQNDPLWDDMCKTAGANISFMIQGNTCILASDDTLKKELEIIDSDSENVLYPCLVTGRMSSPIDQTTATMIAGSQATAKIVSFQENSGYDSYGKTKCLNAPISKEAESAFSNALLKLLERDSANKFTIGNRTYVFWASSSTPEAESAEKWFASIISLQQVDDPDANIKSVRDAFMSIYSGKTISADEDRFYIAGLAPNSARIAVVYWQETSLREFAKNILKHFSDMSIIDGRKEPKPHYGLKDMMTAVTLGGKQSDVQPNLPDATIKAIIEGSPYPVTLYQSALRRIRAEVDKGMQINRIAILKAYLNRTRTNNDNQILEMIDKTNQNVGYLCGRLFAVIEFVQRRALGINSVKERYMNSASATPVAVFPTLLNLSNHHIEKLNSPVFFEKLKGEIMDNLTSSGFPAHLSLQDQGRFFIGYYHQMQDLWQGKNDNDKTEK